MGEETSVNERRSKGNLNGRGLEKEWCVQRPGSDVEGDLVGAFLCDEKLDSLPSLREVPTETWLASSQGRRNNHPSLMETGDPNPITLLGFIRFKHYSRKLNGRAGPGE